MNSPTHAQYVRVRSAATVKAETVGHLWAMDRQTFRRILLKSAFRKRKMYETLLDNVPMLKALQVCATKLWARM